MLKSMTGFGSSEENNTALGRISVELRSSNYKFLETVFHLPETLLSLEDKVKKEIETRLKRGRITCVINILSKVPPVVSVNKALLDNYIAATKYISKHCVINEKPGIDTLMNLPGVLSLAENKISTDRLWPLLKKALNAALNDLIAMRCREGTALFQYLESRIKDLSASLKFIQDRFKKVIQNKMSKIKTDMERTAFLKETDITEEIERLAFHIKNFKNKLSGVGAIGKELDFITQEMQREANTIGAKSCDVKISAKAVQIKSQIEKLKEQLQNIE
jgi:uncharacterized protein (TIGR00255 family)